MPAELGDILRDVVVLAYMFVLRIGVPLLITFFIAKWIQRKLAEQDRAEEHALRGEPHCWDMHNTAQTRRARLAAEAHPDLPCWLAVQSHGEGLTEACFECPRYSVDAASRSRRPNAQRDDASVEAAEKSHPVKNRMAAK